MAAVIVRVLAEGEVSALALGGANFGGIGSARRLIGHGESETEAHALLDHAVALGITLIDTAGSYADGASETMIGRWLGTRTAPERARIKISSKVGLRGGLSADHIATEVARSLDRLGIDALDFHMAHIPDPDTPWPRVVETMMRLKQAGLIRAYGLSNVGADDIHACAATDDRPAFIQNRFNLLDRGDAETGVMAACRQHSIAYTCYSPLAGGLLGGAYAYAGTLPAGSRVAARADLYAHLWTPRLDTRIRALKSLAQDHGMSLAGLAVWWLLHHPGVTTVMLGARTPRQLEGLVRDAIGAPFDADLFAAAEQAAGSGS